MVEKLMVESRNSGFLRTLGFQSRIPLVVHRWSHLLVEQIPLLFRREPGNSFSPYNHKNDDHLKNTIHFDITDGFVVLADDLDCSQFAEVEVAFFFQTGDDVVRFGQLTGNLEDNRYIETFYSLRKPPPTPLSTCWTWPCQLLEAQQPQLMPTGLEPLLLMVSMEQQWC